MNIRVQEILKNKGYVLPIKISHILREGHSKVRETHGLLDTGASITVVNFTIIEYLNLQSNINDDEKLFITPYHHSQKGITCPLKLTFIDQNKQLRDINISVLSVSKKDLDLGKSEVLIGRDILQYFDFNWNGPRRSSNHK